MLAIQPSTPAPRRRSRTLRRDGAAAADSGCIGFPSLLAEVTDQRDERVDLLGRELLPEPVHPFRLPLALDAVEDGHLHLRLAHLLLPGGGGHVGNGHLLAGLRLGLAVDAMATGALR